MSAAADRKQRGAWYTPDALVGTVVDAVLGDGFVDRVAGRPVRIVDPACGDGRFLVAAAERVVAEGGQAHVVGADVDVDAVRAASQALGEVVGRHGIGTVVVEVIHTDALRCDWTTRRATGFDLVIGNPPFLSQMAAATTRGGSSERGGGPYADAAAEFLALAAELVVPDGGRVGFVLPQSLLATRDAGPIRADYDARARLIWSWWTGERVFDAQVLTCALAFEFRPAGSGIAPAAWSHVVTSRRGVPDVPECIEEGAAGCLGDRARLNANFRDEYYGMSPAVGDHAHGPPLITSGLIDPGRSLWGIRPVRFAKRRFERPRIDLALLDEKMRRWAADRLVPKVLIANQTKIIEAVADPAGSWLPGVPVVAAYPLDGVDPATATWEIAALLTSPIASAWAWHRTAGTGLSADAVRVGPVMLADLPWPRAGLDAAVAALRAGDVRACAAAVHIAFGLPPTGTADRALTSWWSIALDRIESRRH